MSGSGTSLWLLIYAAAAAQSWLIAPVLWRRAFAPANRLLAGWLVVVGLDLAIRAWALGQPPLDRFRTALFFLAFPFLHSSLFYLYARNAARGIGLRLSDALHGSGFLLCLLSVSDMIVLDRESLAIAAQSFRSADSSRRFWLFDFGLFVWGASYVVAALIEIGRQRRLLISTRSDGDLATLDWLRHTALWQCAIWSVALLQSQLPRSWGLGPLIYATVAAWVLALGYRALMLSASSTQEQGLGEAREAHKHVEKALPPSNSTSSEPRAADAAPNTDDDPRFDQVEARLQQLVEGEQLYLQPALTIAQLARRSGYPEYLVSNVINQRFGLPFWDYINRYRVLAAQRCLLDPADSRTALDIAYACGFTAKSTFNSAFKRLLGETPSQCRTRSTAAGLSRATANGSPRDGADTAPSPPD